MLVDATTDPPFTTGADTIVIGLIEGEGVPHDLEGGVLGALVESGEAKTGWKKLAHTRHEGTRVVLVGLGKRDELDPERLRQAAAVAHGRAKELGASTLCWEVPHHVGDAGTEAIVEGTLLAAHRDRRFKSKPEDSDGGGAVGRLIVSDHHDRTAAAETARVVAGAVNAARRLQDAPANHATPAHIAERAEELVVQHDHLSVEVMGRDEIVAAGMGAFASVARGAEREPRLITLQYTPPGPRGPVLGLVGKAVTFDTGGISLKPGAKMADMKYDMSGGAAVLEAIGAIAELGLPVRIVGVIGATENMPDGRATRPGDIVTAKTGTTIAVDNTDAEGRLVLADCLAHAIDQGAERVVDLATLTGAVIIALGSTHAGVVSTDDDLAEAVAEAGRASGEITWRLPLHPETAKLLEHPVADITNAPEPRKAGTIVGGEFLRKFVGETPWAHVDIAGVAWTLGRPYAPRGGSGFGVRLLVALARAQATSP